MSTKCPFFSCNFCLWNSIDGWRAHVIDSRFMLCLALFFSILPFAWFECIPLNRFSQHHISPTWRTRNGHKLSWLAGIGNKAARWMCFWSVLGERKWFLIIGDDRSRLADRRSQIVDRRSQRSQDLGEWKPPQGGTTMCSNPMDATSVVSAPLGKV